MKFIKGTKSNDILFGLDRDLIKSVENINDLRKILNSI
jgi:hypothetical protein